MFFFGEKHSLLCTLLPHPVLKLLFFVEFCLGFSQFCCFCELVCFYSRLTYTRSGFSLPRDLLFSPFSRLSNFHFGLLFREMSFQWTYFSMEKRGFLLLLILLGHSLALLVSPGNHDFEFLFWWIFIPINLIEQHWMEKSLLSKLLILLVSRGR